MIQGVSFQPGQTDGTGKQKPTADQGVQEAIKVLSLRLPRVVGAQGLAPAPLLNAQGSGGNRVDSVVNQIMSRMFPTGEMPGGEAPNVGQPQPGESGTMPVSPPVRYPSNTPLNTLMKPEQQWRPSGPPRITPGDRPDQPPTSETQPIVEPPAAPEMPAPKPPPDPVALMDFLWRSNPPMM